MRRFVQAAALVMAHVPCSCPAVAKVPTPAVNETVDLERRSQDVLTILQGRGQYDRIFSPAFRQAISADQIAQVATQLSATLGRPTAVRTVRLRDASTSTLQIAYERGVASFDMTLDVAAPHFITGLRVTGTSLAADTISSITDAFRMLPGSAGFGVYALGAAQPKPVATFRGDVAAPIASSFKLWVLSALSRSIDGGERRWSDVISLGMHTPGSGVLEKWPEASPLTLHSLATLMISVSDNRAADTLMTALGRTRVDAAASASGATGLILTTRETTAIKSDPTLSRRWGAASQAVRRDLLRTEVPTLLSRPIDRALFASGSPVAVEDVEWFASPAQLARTLDGLRGPEAATARAILAVNPGVASATAARFRYLGYKGGSEPGVLSLAFLIATADDQWFAVIGNWHNVTQAIDEPRFVGLMDRLLTQVAAPSFGTVGGPKHTGGE